MILASMDVILAAKNEILAAKSLILAAKCVILATMEMFLAPIIMILATKSVFLATMEMFLAAITMILATKSVFFVRRICWYMVQAYTYLQARRNLDYELRGTVYRSYVIPRQIWSVHTDPDLYGQYKYAWESLQVHREPPGSPQNLSEVSENRNRAELAHNAEIRYKFTLLYGPGRYPDQSVCRVVPKPT